ncbi:MAG: OsmC family protein [Propionibacteriaceae bacterium]|jgi:uncharacterized OsmC-like protein|nr:OsmC family protein [Propionibacteriaceae bacterium]
MANITVERVETRIYRGSNGRGQEVMIGPKDTEGVFSPGELLQLALAGCAGMSSDLAITRRVGEVPRTVEVEAVHHETEDRFTSFAERITLHADIDAETLEAVRQVAIRAIETGCTIGLTIERSAPVSHEIVAG